MRKRFAPLLIILAFASCDSRPHTVVNIPTFAINPDIQSRVDSHSFPKLSNQLQLCCREKHTLEQLEQIHFWDIAVVEVELIPNLDTYLGASGTIRTRNPNAIVLGVFSAGDVYKSYNQPIHDGFHRMFLPEWYLYDVAKKPVPLFKINSEWTLAQNPLTKVSQGLPDYLNKTVMSTNFVDGILYDWATTSVSWMNHRKPPRNKAIDIDNDAKRDSDKKVDQLWRQGFEQMLMNSRNSFPSGALILGNGGWNNGWEYAPFLNGIMIEQFLEGRKWNKKRFGWGAIMKTYAHYQSHSVSPRLSIVMVNQDDLNNFDAVRFGLASTLMFDGYFSFSNRKGAYRVSRWFDEYSVDLQTGKAERHLNWKGYLGKPLGSAFNANKPSETLQAVLSKNAQDAEKKVWRRDFQNGIVLVNPGKLIEDLDLKGEFRKISGTVDPYFNNGQPVTKISLARGNGIILLNRTPRNVRKTETRVMQQ